MPNFLPVALRLPSIALIRSGREEFLFCFAVTGPSISKISLICANPWLLLFPFELR
jgi:hypothetical protein